MSEIKTIGILTSGGDAPGMNAAVRSVVRTALYNGLRVIGINKGFDGLLKKNVQELQLRSVSGTLQHGGTMLMTARSDEFREDSGVEKGAQNCRELGIDSLIVCGGDGSFRGGLDLSKKGIPCVGIPCTIDNDIPCSDYTIGFDTAVNTVADIIDKLRDTSQSHNRCSIVEVMGNKCGDIALYAGIATGAESVLIPENKLDLEQDVLNYMRDALLKGKTHFIIITAEGVTGESNKNRIMTTQELAEYIERETGIESRATVIGHVQRGGKPTIRDRVVASQMGNYAVHLLMKDIGNRLVVMKDNRVTDLDITEALAVKRTTDTELLHMFREIL